MATIKEIAEKAGVSIGTVDRVLHDRGRVSAETKAAVLKLVEELNYKPNSVAQGLSIMKKKLRLAFFVVDPSEHPFFEDVLAGAREKAQELAQYGVEVEFYISDIENKSFHCENLAVDGIAMLPMPQFIEVRQYAKDHAIPLIYFNIPMEGGLAYVGCDYQKSGRIAAGLCGILSDGAGKVGILSEGDMSVISLRDRIQGFSEEIKTRYPSMSVTKVYTTRTYDQEAGLNEAAETMFSEHPDLDIVYLVNPGGYQVVKTIRRLTANPNLKVITNDLTSWQRPMVESGLITATICQQPKQQGELALELLFKHLTGSPLTEGERHFTELSIHISQNV